MGKDKKQTGAIETYVFNALVLLLPRWVLVVEYMSILYDSVDYTHFVSSAKNKQSGKVAFRSNG